MTPPPDSPALRGRRSPADRAVLWLAQGFGSGLLPGGPGTWGSLVGVAWLVLQLAWGHPGLWLAINLALIPVAAVLCSRAEILLGRHDPSSVVIDEIIAVPFTFLGSWMLIGFHPNPVSGGLSGLLHALWPELVTGFVAFRLFDILKPGPIGRLQRLPAGWGVVADDVAAGVAAAVVTAGVTYWRLRS